MIYWKFSAEDYSEKNFQPIPVGDHRVRIAEVNEKMSQNNNQMIELVLEVSGYGSKLWHNIVFMKDNPQLTNQRLGEFWNSFGIPQGDFNLPSWVGKVGAARVKHDTYEGNVRPKVSYFIAKSRQETLPPWKGEGKATPAYDPINELPDFI